MIISESPMDWDDVYERIRPYSGDDCDPLYDENGDHKFDYWAQGGRYAWMLGGKLSCRLGDFPMIRPEDDEETLKGKCGHLWQAWKENPKGQTCEECFRTWYCFCLVLPDGTWLEPGRNAWWLGEGAKLEEDIDWVAEFGKIIDSYPKDWTINIIDCHD